MWIFSLSLQEPPCSQAQLELWKAQISLWGPRKAEFLPKCGLQQLMGISHSHRRKCSSQGLFFLTCKEMVPPSKACQPFTSPQGFSAHKPQVFTPDMSAQTGRSSWGRTCTDHAKWSETQIQGFAFKQIPDEVWCWRHPRVLENPFPPGSAGSFPGNYEHRLHSALGSS